MDNHKANILVVDDTLQNLRLLIGILSEQGYEVRPADSGQAALMTVEVKAPDLILLDIDMPGIDGYEVCQRLKNNKNTCNIPVIFISALDEVFDKVKAFDVGGIDYIPKPFQVEEVLARVETHLALYQLQKQLEKKNRILEETNIQLKREIEVRKHTEAKLEELAITDSLTKLYNRRHFFDLAKLEFTRSKRYHLNLAAMMIDLDHFKQINDYYGHRVGDCVLETVSWHLHTGIRSTDILGRYGGEEFILLLPQTSLADGQILAERLRKTIAMEKIVIEEHSISTTISIGLTMLMETDKTIDMLINRADQALYAAKRAGRNQVSY